VEEHLRFGAGFPAADRPRILGALSALAPHLSGWEDDQVDLEVSLKDTEGKDPKVTQAAEHAGAGQPASAWPREQPDSSATRSTVEVCVERLGAAVRMAGSRPAGVLGQVRVGPPRDLGKGPPALVSR
jgi:hypothetical protein